MSLTKNSPRKVADLLEQLGHTADGVFAVDRQHRIIFWNQAAEFLLGYSTAEVLGKHCEEVIRGCDGNGAPICGKQCSRFEEAKKLRWSSHQDVRTRSKSGHDVCIDVSTVAVLSPRRELSTLVHIFRKTDGIKRLPTYHETVTIPQPRSVSPLLLNFLPTGDNGNEESLPLSSRELAVLRYLAEGMNTWAISGRLFISPTTVRNHVQSILRKLQVHSRLQAIALALHRRYIGPL